MHPDARLTDAADIRISPLLSSGTLGAMKLHVGCAMWTHAPWQGRYLPHSLSPRDRLRAYATWCNAVEGNTTFYATPALDTVKSWAGQTTPDFRFIRYGTARSSSTRDRDNSSRALSVTSAPSG